jgi:two-component system, response regulator, stage 0 sporulation protein F
MEDKNQLSVLYVDDEQINLDLFRFNFRSRYIVHTAFSGNEGLAVLKSYPSISVVISDMKMPGMNGIEFIRKAKIHHKNIVFFILTGFDITPEISDAINEKLINKYFRKPFNMKEIEASIREAFEVDL